MAAPSGLPKGRGEGVPPVVGARAQERAEADAGVRAVPPSPFLPRVVVRPKGQAGAAIPTANVGSVRRPCGAQVQPPYWVLCDACGEKMGPTLLPPTEVREAVRAARLTSLEAFLVTLRVAPATSARTRAARKEARLTATGVLGPSSAGAGAALPETPATKAVVVRVGARGRPRGVAKRVDKVAATTSARPGEDSSPGRQATTETKRRAARPRPQMREVVAAIPSPSPGVDVAGRGAKAPVRAPTTSVKTPDVDALEGTTALAVPRAETLLAGGATPFVRRRQATPWSTGAEAVEVGLRAAAALASATEATVKPEPPVVLIARSAASQGGARRVAEATPALRGARLPQAPSLLPTMLLPH